MKLTWRIVIRISLLMSLALAAWAVLFHNAVLEEVDDETDDALELFTTNLIQRVLRGEELPAANNGTNNTYFLESVTAEYVLQHPRITFDNEVVFIRESNNNEQARVMRTVFEDAQGKYYLLTVATPTLDKDDLREALSFWIALLYGTLLLLTVVVCLWVLWRSMRPLYRILRWLDENDISKGVAPLVNPTRMSEFVRLNETLVRSAERSEQLFSQQKQFIGNASHEVQTPLAICKSRLDMLLDTPLSEEQMGEVIKVQQTLDYISRLNKELLLLAKIDGGQFADTIPIDIAALAAQVAEDCGMVFEQQGRGIRINIAEPLTVAMNPTLASILVTNFVKNAFTHNSNCEDIHIYITRNTLRIANAGDAALDASHIFERFYQCRKREGSTGLGLAIAKAITDLYGFQIRYDFTDKHHVFTIKFN